MFNALADGDARVENFLPGADCLSTIHCLTLLGVAIDVPRGGREVTVHGRGLRLREPAGVLDAGNSGTTFRLLTGILAGQPFFSVLTGDESLRGRPMARVARPLVEMGARIWGRNEGTLAPLAILGGGLHGIGYDSPVASAQVKSAILLAGLFAGGETSVTEPWRSRDHTERMLGAMGAPLSVEGTRVSVTAAERLSPLSIRVPGDISSAAFWLVAGAVHPDAEVTVEGVGVNPTRTGVLDVLRAMGAELGVTNQRDEGGEPVADVTVRSSRLRGTVIEGELVPRAIDELPVLALAASLAEGETVVRDAAELRVKESDRVATVADQLGRLGAEIEPRPDGFRIRGVPCLRGAAVETSGDHRLAMTLAVAGLLADGSTAIEGSESVDVSYPGFWRDLRRLTSP